MSFDLILIVCAALLGLAVIPVVHRMMVGPTILDRAVGMDILLVYVVMGLGLYTAVTGEAFAIIPSLALTGTGFIGTLALARFVSREESGHDQGSEGQTRAEAEAEAEEEAKAEGVSAPAPGGPPADTTKGGDQP